MPVAIAILRGGPFEGRVVPFPAYAGTTDPTPYRHYRADRADRAVEFVDTEHGPARVVDYRPDLDAPRH